MGTQGHSLGVATLFHERDRVIDLTNKAREAVADFSRQWLDGVTKCLDDLAEVVVGDIALAGLRQLQARSLRERG